MTAEIICVGTELLLGNVVNRNGAYLARKLADLGIACHFQSIVGDEKECILEVLKTAVQRADVLILSGGMGPTKDDITKETAAEFCGRKLVEDAGCRQHLQDFFQWRGITPAKECWKMAMIPEGSTVFENENGTAPGLAIEYEGRKLILLPGPPTEMQPMFEKSIIPYLKGESKQVIISQTVKMYGSMESQVEILLGDLIEKQENPSIAVYACGAEVHVRVTASAENEKEAHKLIKPLIKEVKQRFGREIYTTEGDVTLEKSLADLLLSAELSITCAESCTGGLLSATLVNVPGISELYKAGLITYSNKAKRKLLGVKKATLQKYGAVSRQTAEEMVKGLLADSKTDVGIAITGIAGPDGGTKEKPVGLVYIACCVKGKVTVEEYHFGGSRDQIRQSSVTAALMQARNCVLEYLSKVTFGK